MDERLELRREHHVHEDERQREGDAEVVGGAAELARLAARHEVVARLHAERCEGGFERRLASACEMPGAGLAEMVIWRWRLSRSIEPVPSLRSNVTRLRSCTSSPDWRCAPSPRPSDSGVRRNESCALRTTSYWSLAALNVVTSWPAISALTVCETSWTRTPRSAARWRSMSTRSSGRPGWIAAVGVDDRRVLVDERRCALAVYWSSFARSGPTSAYWICAPRPPANAQTAGALHRDRSPPCGRAASAVRAWSISSLLRVRRARAIGSSRTKTLPELLAPWPPPVRPAIALHGQHAGQLLAQVARDAIDAATASPRGSSRPAGAPKSGTATRLRPA